MNPAPALKLAMQGWAGLPVALVYSVCYRKNRPQESSGNRCLTHQTAVEISRYVPYVYFITLPCILLLSRCFGFTCTPLTLLQLRYILWCLLFILG